MIMTLPGSISYVTAALMPTEKAHGVSIAHMCAAFAAEGARVELVVPARRNPISEDIFSYYGVPRTFSVRMLPAPDFVGRGLAHPFFFFIQRLLFARAAKRAGIAHGIVYTREPEIAAAFSKTHAVVYEAHRCPRGLAGWLTARLIRNCALVVCNSRGTEAAVRAAGVKRTLVAPNGFDPAQFEGPVPPRAGLGLPGGMLALYAGSDSSWKGAGIVREAVPLLGAMSALSVAVVGGRRAGRDGALVEIGRVKPDRVPAYLRSADILLLPNTSGNEESERFTSPVKLFEYLAAGKAVIASDLPSIREILGPDDALLVPAGNAAALAEAVARLAVDVSYRARLGGRAAALAKAYTWRARAARILSSL